MRQPIMGNGKIAAELTRIIRTCATFAHFYAIQDRASSKGMKTPSSQDLSDLRRSKGLSQSELARRLGIPRTELCKIESGRIRPSLEEVRLIAQALETAEDEVIQAVEQLGSKLWTPKSERALSSQEGFRREREESPANDS